MLILRIAFFSSQSGVFFLASKKNHQKNANLEKVTKRENLHVFGKTDRLGPFHPKFGFRVKVDIFSQ